MAHWDCVLNSVSMTTAVKVTRSAVPTAVDAPAQILNAFHTTISHISVQTLGTVTSLRALAYSQMQAVSLQMCVLKMNCAVRVGVVADVPGACFHLSHALPSRIRLSSLAIPVPLLDTTFLHVIATMELLFLFSAIPPLDTAGVSTPVLGNQLHRFTPEVSAQIAHVSYV